MKKTLLFLLLILNCFVFNAQSDLFNFNQNNLSSTQILENGVQQSLDLVKLKKQLKNAPKQFNLLEKSSSLIISLPNQYGIMKNYYVIYSSIMSPEFQEAFPDIKTYQIISTETQEIYGRFTLSSFGLNAYIITPEGSLGISPVDINSPVEHNIYLGNQPNTLLSTNAQHNSHHECGLTEEGNNTPSDVNNNLAPTSGGNSLLTSNGTVTKTYDFAAVATSEFTAFNGGTTASATTAIVNSVNSAQVIYDKDLAVRFNLLTPVIYNNTATDPFIPENAASPNGMGGAGRTIQASNAIAMSFASSTFDIGQVFHTHDLIRLDCNTNPLCNDDPNDDDGWSNGGVAGLGVVCSNAASGSGVRKAAGWSGSFDNTSNGWIGLLTHELAHMFGAPHTFNGTGGSCTTAISDDTAYEIGSGTTLMSYEGICSDPQNIPNAGGVSDNYFHANSLELMVNYINSQSCETGVLNGNTPPVITTNPCSGALTIPVGTPFILTGSGTDADGDQILYTWEQYDEDGAGTTPTQGFIGATAAASSIAPLFRSYPPSSSPTRYFPAQSLVIANDYASDFEPLPTVARTLNFRLTGRDCNPNGGGINDANLTLTVDASQGVFSVLAPNGGENLTAGNTTTVTWNSNTFTTNVNIKLSVDGGNTYPYNLATSTANDGSELITIPGGVPNTTTARVIVESADNDCVVFYDISNTDFNITSSCNAIGSVITNTGATSFSEGSNVALTVNNSFVGNPISSYTATTFGTTGSYGANADGVPGCTSKFDSYEVLNFTADVTGTYTFAQNPVFVGFTLYDGIFNSASPCNGFLSSTLTDTGGGTGVTSASLSATITSGSSYSLLITDAFGGSPKSVAFSGPGNISEVSTLPANYAYTYIAINSSNTIAGQSATADFGTLAAGSYTVYGIMYLTTGTGMTDPATWSGTLSDLLSSGACALPSNNSVAITVTATCPDLSTTPANVTVTESSCMATCTVGGGVITAPTGTPCPAGSTLQYSVGGGAWSTTLPAYDQTNALSIQTRCECNSDNSMVSAASTAVLTVPGSCTDPAFTLNLDTQPTCTVDGSISFSGAGLTFMSSTDGVAFAAATSPITITAGSAAAVTYTIRATDANGCTTDMTTNVAAVTNCCPDLSATPANVTVTESSCMATCTVMGGVITAPTGTPCPANSTLQYSVDGGAWSATLPTYNQTGPAQSIETRCNCNSDNTMSSPSSTAVLTVPGSCTDPAFTPGFTQPDCTTDGSITFAGTDMTFEVNIDGAGYNAATSPITLTQGEAAAMVYQIRATDTNTACTSVETVNVAAVTNCTSCPAVGDLVISEFIQNPAAVGDAFGEWFEVFNTTGSDIDMNGMTISDADTDAFTITSSVVVPANGYAVFGINADMAVNGGVMVDYDYNGFTLGNSVDEIIITCNGTIIDQVNYDNGATFPDPTGASTALDIANLDATSNDTGSNWCNGTTAYGDGDLGTPGAANPSCTPACPTFTTAPDNVTVTESSCMATCTVMGGVITAPTGTPCPANSTLQYSVDGGTWSTTLPTYNQTTALSIETRCQCDADNAMVSATSTAVLTVPGTCTDPAFTPALAQPDCTTDGSITFAGTNMTFEVNIDGAGYNTATSPIALTQGEAAAMVYQIRATDTNTSCTSVETVNVAAVINCCPIFAAAPANVTVVESSCMATCTVMGGVITAPTGTPCPANSTLQYSIDGGAWSTTLPTYDQTTAISIQTRCECDFDNNITSAASVAVLTVPGSCTDPAFTPGFTQPDCTTDGSITFAGTDMTFEVNIDGAGYNAATSPIALTQGEAAAMVYQIRATDTNTSCTSVETVNVAAVTGCTAPCPDLSATPANVTITESSCMTTCTVMGGVITAPTGTPCPANSTLQYSVDGGAWSATLPTYNQTGPAQSIETRCNCNSDNTMSSPSSTAVLTVPGSCTDPAFSPGFTQPDCTTDGSITFAGTDMTFEVNIDGAGYNAATSPIALTQGEAAAMVYQIRATDTNTGCTSVETVNVAAVTNCTSCPAVGDLVISEFIQNPAAVGDAFGEWFEVFNTTGSDIDMNGMTISDADTDAFTITSSVVVPANGYAVFGINADMAVNGGVMVDYDYNGFTLGNSVDEIIITCNGTIIDQVNYDNGATFPDPTGASTALDIANLDATSNDTGSNWCNGTTAYGDGDLGTPGAANPSCTPACPTFTTAPDNVTVTESSCMATCNVMGGVITAPTGTPCPANSTLQYSVDGGAWSTTLPTYNQTSALSIETRCQCDADNSMVSATSTAVLTVPGSCTDPAFTPALAQPDCTTDGSITFAGTNMTFEVNIDGAGYNAATSPIALTQGEAAAMVYQIRATDTNTGCTSVETVNVAAVINCCPIFAAAPANVTVVESSCMPTCTVMGGVITAPTGTPCPANSTLQYSIDGGAWSTTLPTYDQTTAISIQTRCECDFDNNITSATSVAVLTVPGSCTDPAFTPGFTQPDCTTDGSITFAGTDMTFEVNIDGAGYNDATSPIALTQGEAAAMVYQIRATDTNTGCTSVETVNVAAVTGCTAPCPDLSATPANVTITESSCMTTCTVMGGVITAPTGTPCPANSTLQYSVDGGAWSATLPTYNQTGPAQSIETRCNCNSDNTMSSPSSTAVLTVPGSCTDPAFTPGFTQPDCTTDGSITFAGTDMTFEVNIDGAGYNAATSPIALTQGEAAAMVYQIRATDTNTGCTSVETVNVAAVTGCATCPTNAEAFISEFHYDDAGADTGEFIEVAVANTYTGNLSDLQVTLYNGNGGASYNSETLDNFTVGATDANFTYFTWETPLQNGGPDGMSLACNGTLLEFLSYEGTFTAVGGDADGVTSTPTADEPGSAPEGSSVQIIGGVWTYTPGSNTGGSTNGIFCAISSVNISSAPICNVNDAEFTIEFTAANASGNYDLINTADNSILGQIIGGVTDGTFTIPVTLTGPTASSTLNVNVVDANDGACIGTAIDVAIPECPPSVPCPTIAEAFINEFHYDDAGTDNGEFIEIAIDNAYAGDLSTLTVTLYNGNGGVVYNSETLNNFTVGSTDTDYTYYTWSVSPQNGPDAIALSCNGTIIEFIGYEGDVTATEGVADGMTSTNIGVSETSSTPEGSSLQIIGGVWTYTQGANTEGNTNGIFCTISNVNLAGVAICNGDDAQFTIAFNVANASGDYNLINTVDNSILAQITAGATDGALTLMGTITGPTSSATTINVNVVDANDGTCIGTAVDVTLADCPSSVACPTATEAFINEVHYDDAGGDDNEFIEVAVANTYVGNLSDITVTLYNGNGGSTYSSETLDNMTVGNTDANYTYYIWNPASIQNGGPDGIALSCDNVPIQFLSYEGTFTATNGPAAGTFSTEIGAEPGNTPEGSSLQLIDGTWYLFPGINTAGDTNVFPPCGITNLTVNPAPTCSDNDAIFNVNVNIVSGSGDYNVINTADNSIIGQIIGGASSASITIPCMITGPTTAEDINITVVDANDPTCIATAIDVSIPTCCTAPTLICRQPVSTCSKEDMCGHDEIILLPPFIFGGCGVVSVYNDAPDFYPIGTTIVTWFVEDITGDITSCETEVYIYDVILPTIEGLYDMVLYTENSCFATAIINPTISDNCGAYNASGTGIFNFPIGIHEHTVTVEDQSGTVTSTTITIAVHDVDAPEALYCPNDIVVTNATNNSIPFPAFTDNCGVISLENDAPEVFPTGETLVTWTANDSYGNEGTCSYTVTATAGPNELVSNPEGEEVTQDRAADEQLFEVEDIVIFPSPATDYINIRIPSTYNGTNGYVTIRDASGKTIMEKVVGEFSSLLYLDVAELTNGIYFLELKNKKESSISKSFTVIKN